MRISITASVLILGVTLFITSGNVCAGQYQYTTDSLKITANEKRERVGKTYWFVPSESMPKSPWHPFTGSLDKIYFSERPTSPMVNSFQVLETESFKVLEIFPDKKNYGIYGYYKIKFESGKTAYIEISDFDKSFSPVYQPLESRDTIYPEPPEKMNEKPQSHLIH